MNILIIDNNDSFTYNIVELIRNITSNPIRVKPSVALDINEIKRYNRIILSPGPGLSYEFPILAQILKMYGGKIPILGICLGHQAICEFFGAKLSNLPLVVHGQPKKIFVKKNTQLFKKIPNEFTVGLYHSWIVRRSGFPEDLYITGLSEDDIIMSVEHKNLQIYGVQFHPESYITEYGKQLITNFLEI